MQAANTQAGKCTASGEGLSKAQAGIPAAFQIKAVDCYGNRRNSGAASNRMCGCVQSHGSQVWDPDWRRRFQQPVTCVQSQA